MKLHFFFFLYMSSRLGSLWVPETRRERGWVVLFILFYFFQVLHVQVRWFQSVKVNFDLDRRWRRLKRVNFNLSWISNSICIWLRSRNWGSKLCNSIYGFVFPIIRYMIFSVGTCIAANREFDAWFARMSAAKPLKKLVKCVLLDLDGTLLNTGQL